MFKEFLKIFKHLTVEIHFNIKWDTKLLLGVLCYMDWFYMKNGKEMDIYSIKYQTPKNGK